MNLQEFLLAQLAEEAAEIAQRAVKCMRFGMDDKQTAEHETNKWRLYNEIVDLHVIMDFLAANEVFDFDAMMKEEEGDHYARKWMNVIDWARRSMMTENLDGSAYVALKEPKKTAVNTANLGTTPAEGYEDGFGHVHEVGCECNFCYSRRLVEEKLAAKCEHELALSHHQSPERAYWVCVKCGVRQ